jgi:hypothetical protein
MSDISPHPRPRGDCPTCLGIGRLDDRGFQLVGQPYFDTQRCKACGGSGNQPVPQYACDTCATAPDAPSLCPSCLESREKAGAMWKGIKPPFAGRQPFSGAVTETARYTLATNVVFEISEDRDGMFVRACAFGVEGPWMKTQISAFRALMQALSKTGTYLFTQMDLLSKRNGPAEGT